MSAETYPACTQCAAGHHAACDGFRETLDADHPCGCYIERPAEMHPQTHRGRQVTSTLPEVKR